VNVGNQTRYRPADLDEDSTYFFAVTPYDKYGRESQLSKELGPSTIALFQNYPDPFNALTNITFGLLARSRVRICIYNVLGQVVRKVPAAEEYELGVHSVAWDGRDSRDRPVCSGVYLYCLITPTGATARRVILLR
jgi:hypothetical protein